MCGSLSLVMAVSGCFGWWPSRPVDAKRKRKRLGSLSVVVFRHRRLFRGKFGLLILHSRPDSQRRPSEAAYGCEGTALHGGRATSSRLYNCIAPYIRPYGRNTVTVSRRLKNITGDLYLRS
ncbi:hypothetical protein DFH07DRAFT_396734 [Mycena maculata]|uniref:Secreted protein n=1 Tax=Mycena maculata TaxID=230809 RepID=A0AAD7NK27_9AGAR|nr:hypothetical protein DFH07DRAFT_396734 [Mycena maculata]